MYDSSMATDPIGQFAYEITLIQPVLEPSSLALCALGLAGIAGLAARLRKSAAE